MRTARHIVAIGCLMLGVPAGGNAQSLVPITDEVQEPLLPPGISKGDVELFGTRAYLFRAEDGAEVIHVVGGFELHLGRRRSLSAREAVVWMTPRTYQGISYHRLEVFLWRDARVTESAGTTTSGPVLWAVLNSSGKVSIGADDTTTVPSMESPTYQRAADLRGRLAAAEPADVETQPPLRVIEPGAVGELEKPTVRPHVAYRAENFQSGEVEGRQVVTAIGDVYLFQGDPSGGDPLELRADAAVLFLSAEAAEEPALGPSPGEGEEAPRDLLEEESQPSDFAVSELAGGELLSGTAIEGVYLEGDVILSRGERMVRASQLYYDFAKDRALILDAVARAIEPTRDVPVYVRAGQVRQLSRTEYAAWDAKITTSEFYTPHYYVGAKKTEFTDRTSRSAAGVRAGLRAGTFKAYHTTFNLGGVPLAYWPYIQGDFKEGESSIRGIRSGYSSNFGGAVETEWHLFNLMGLERPQGFDATLRLDYYTARGPAAGIDLDYERDTYFGLFRGYYIHDDGVDNLGRYRDEKPDTRERGRTTLRHRHYLPEDWELTIEASYMSDRGFLEEYFESEFEEGKEQETLLYLKKQKDTWAFTGLAQWRILDWLTQTEHLPELAFRLIGEPVGGFTTLYSENRAGLVRYRPGERELLEYLFLRAREDSSGMVVRADTRQEAEFPVLLGPIKVVPFGTIRGTVWDDSPDSGGLQRGMGIAGVRSSMYLSRVFPALRNELLDINGIRHVIKMDTVAWVAGSNVDSDELYPLTPGIEDIDEIDGVTVGVRQRWQTHRGGPARQRTVDVVMLDVELGLFSDAPDSEVTSGFTSYSRPEDSVARNYVNGALAWRVNDSTALLSEANVDLNDGSMDVFNLSLAVERDPRLSYMLGYRYIGDINSNLLALGANYRISEKHTLAFRESFDLGRGETQEFTVGFIRKFPRWYVALTVDLNEADDDFGVSLSAWPEGLRRAALGSRRFTGLAESTGIRPE
ncbi:MAG TPA: hypothetical protein VM243_09175 [Phycisphaerae bacterium]|nr:hypothetical protein [Phycisphaerae bacterium]